MGFLSCLPGIWRALQCVRRYWDTRNKFPHLLNFSKYLAIVVFYMTLSIYRVNKTYSNRVVLIVFAIINAIYTSFWDIYFDWRLGNPQARHPFLREELGYRKIWTYYAAMVINPILHLNWVLYLVSPLHLQHSAQTSFVVALVEIIRRGIWSIFRVENEHCMNDSRFRVSHDLFPPHDDLPGLDIKYRAADEQGDESNEE